MSGTWLWVFGTRRRMAFTVMALVTIAAAWTAVAATPQSPPTKRVAILQSASPTSGSYELSAAGASGVDATIVDAATWRSMSTADFSAYDALVIPERSCTTAFSTLRDTQAAWAPAIVGNELIIGTDPSDHQSQGGAALVRNGIAFAADGPGTGVYIAFECDGLDANVVALMDDVSGSTGGFGSQTADCYNQSHRVADHPAFSDTTDGSLSNWSCSVHNVFTRFPDPYRVLAIAEGLGIFTAPDGSIGLPYVLASGDSVTYAGRDITALGDSVSAGEGIGYGYEWDNGDERWKDRNGSSAFWDVSYGQPIGCHQSDAAHPRALAALTGASLREHLSCTGATYNEGIAGIQPTDGVTQPQVGGFIPGPAINPAYQASEPDLVTLSLGANDIEFANVVTTCFYPLAQVVLGGCGGNIDEAEDRISDGYVRDRYANAYRQIQNVGDLVGKRPLVLHTQYINPFPTSGQDNDCFDIEGGWTSGFSRDEINAMIEGLRDLNALIASEAAKADGVVSVPVSSAFKDHTFCSDDPWVFGMDTAIDLRGDFSAIDVKTSAPFHPTARGQLELAKQIRVTLDSAVSMRRTGANVEVPYASGEKLRFANVTTAGTTVVRPVDEDELPAHRSFKVNAGWLIETAAEHTGAITVTLPATTGDKLWHFADGSWEQVTATFDGTKLIGDVSSLSPFAVGPKVAPVTAVITGGEGGVVPENVHFSAATSTGDIASATWDFGDGAHGAGFDVQHSYAYSGNYEVKVTVRSDGGAVDTATKTVVITNPGPVVVADVPATGRVGDDVVLDSRWSTDSNGEVKRGWWEVDGKILDPEGQRNVLRLERAGRTTVVAVVLDDELKEARKSYAIEVSPAVTPPAGPPTTPTPTPTTPASPLPPPADRTAPLARLSGARVQQLFRRISVTLTCVDEPCRATATGRVAIPRIGARRASVRTLGAARTSLAKGKRAQLKLSLGSPTRAAIRRALARKRKVVVALKVVVRDAAGNERTLTRRIRLRL